MAEAAYSLEQAVADMDDTSTALVEAPNSVPATYDPGQLEGRVANNRSQGGLTVEQAADLIEDDGRPTGTTVAYHNGHPLTLPQLVQGFSEGVQLAGALQDYHSRLRWVQQAGENVYVGAMALAGFITNTLFPAPNADLAYTDPAGYLHAKAIHDQVADATIEVVQAAQGIAYQNAEWARAQIPKDDIAIEAASFREAYPQATNPEWLKQFGERITQAAEHCGYHASELNAVTDHRALKVLDLAAAGLEKRRGTKREEAKPSKPRPRLVSSNDDSLTLSEAMNVDFD